MEGRYEYGHYVAPNGLHYDSYKEYKEEGIMSIDINNVTVAEDTTINTLKVKEDDTMTNMTVAKLRKEAKKAGITGYSRMRKVQLISLLSGTSSEEIHKRYPDGLIINSDSFNKCIRKALRIKDDDSMFKKIETFKFKNIAAAAKNALDDYSYIDDTNTVLRRVDSAFNSGGDNYAVAWHKDGGFLEYKVSNGYGLYKETKKGWKFVADISDKENASIVNKEYLNTVLRGEELWKSLNKKKFVSIVEPQFVKQSLIKYNKLFYKTKYGTYDVSRTRLCGVIGYGFEKCGINEKNNHLMTLAIDLFVQNCVLSQRLESDKKEGQSTYFTTKDVLNNLHKMYKEEVK